MDNIHIKRYENDDEISGCIEPEDRSWQLLIDKEGFPRLIVRVKSEEEDGRLVHGYMAVDDILPPGMSIPEVMQGTFGGQLPPEEEQRLLEEGFGSKAPCPR